MQKGTCLYIVRCSDGSFYFGTTRAALDARISQHKDGTFKGYTEARRPVVLIFSEFDRITDAIVNERKLKGWSCAKKEAFIRGDLKSLRQLSKRKSPHPSRRLLRSLLIRMRRKARTEERGLTARSAGTSGRPSGSACRQPRRWRQERARRRATGPAARSRFSPAEFCRASAAPSSSSARR